MNKKKFLKWLCLVLFIGSGVYTVFAVPEAVESFLPTVNTVRPEKAEYCRTVQGSGIILTTEKESNSYLNEETWLVQIAVNESEIRFIEKGQTAELRGAAFDDGIYTAKVMNISNTAHQVQVNSGLIIETVIDVTLQIENPDENLRAGYSVQALINIGEPREVWVVPYEVICQDEASEYVYILKGNIAKRCDIKTGAELAEGAELLFGLYETDEIITSPESVESGGLVKREEMSVNINNYEG